MEAVGGGSGCGGAGQWEHSCPLPLLSLQFLRAWDLTLCARWSLSAQIKAWLCEPCWSSVCSLINWVVAGVSSQAPSVLMFEAPDTQSILPPLTLKSGAPRGPSRCLVSWALRPSACLLCAAPK